MGEKRSVNTDQLAYLKLAYLDYTVFKRMFKIVIFSRFL